MFRKISQKIKAFFSQNYKFLLCVFIFIILSMLPLPYYIDMPGGAINIMDKIEVEGKKETKGSLNFAYVSEIRATPLTYLYSFFHKDWKRIKKENVVYDHETVKDMEFRDHLLLEESNDSATILAYEKLNKELHISRQHLYITYIDADAKTDLKVGDELLSVNGVKIISREQLTSIITSHKKNDQLTFTVKNKEKEYTRTATLVEKEGKVLIGTLINVDKDLKTRPSLTIQKEANESGPSGGLMMTLAIYSSLSGEDIIKGRKIVGTGTIDEAGNVGSIGGIEFKVRGAVKEKAEIFIVPAGDNYEAAKALKEKENFKIEIKAVSTFEEALAYLLKS